MSRPPLPAGPYLVVGMARSGSAAALALVARGERVIATDRRGPPQGDELAAAGVEWAAEPLAALPAVGCVIKSPGVPREDPVIEAALARGIEVLGELEMAWRLLPNEFVAVTGTNGKTTTVELIGAMYRAGGRPAVVAGNVGFALSRFASAPPHGDGPLDPSTTIICEASSFQLEDAVAFAPRIAVLLNTAPDHLDRHHTMDAYLAAKLRIFAAQKPGDLAVLAQGAPPVPGHARRVPFGAGAGAELRSDRTALWWQGERLIELRAIRLRGAHNVENAMAAAAAALSDGVAAEGVVEALTQFAGVAHRLEEVASVGGVLFVNDSKATNIASTLAALAAFDAGTVHLIVGGVGKEQDFTALRDEVAARARGVYAIGAAAGEIGSALAGLEVHRCGTLEHAVEAARTAALPGEVILLSPACASFDQFRDFEARGEAFRQLVARAGTGRV